ncbi:cell division protein FtsA [Desulforamulus ferrireducens]|uniref:Cell division protein FtsA n=1 Tax=Desulforamulus ferrireducens TaxID=1833852 RepID=A0A1S6IU89_9FIRM|nr:cell division protein FtsA [Desulforamulus ferrireducens]
MARGHIVCGLDIGTTKVVSVIAEVGPNGYPQILGMGECPTIGVRKGAVTDETALGKSLSQAVLAAETMAKESVKTVYLASPLASQLTGWESLNEQLLNSVQLIGLQPIELVPSVVTAAEALLTDTDKKLGTVLLDLGGLTSNLAIFDGGVLTQTNSLAVGSEHISSDLALCLRTTISEGERIKKLLGVSYAETEDFVEVRSVGGNDQRKVPLRAVRDIIESRVKEILELAHQAISQACRPESLAGGVIFTGGGALLAGLLPLAKNVLQVSKLAIGRPGRVGVPDEMWVSPEYASAIGLAIYGAKRKFRRTGRISGWRQVLDKFM